MPWRHSELQIMTSIWPPTSSYNTEREGEWVRNRERETSEKIRVESGQREKAGREAMIIELWSKKQRIQKGEWGIRGGEENFVQIIVCVAAPWGQVLAELNLNWARAWQQADEWVKLVCTRDGDTLVSSPSDDHHSLKASLYRGRGVRPQMAHVQLRLKLSERWKIKWMLFLECNWF